MGRERVIETDGTHWTTVHHPSSTLEAGAHRAVVVGLLGDEPFERCGIDCTHLNDRDPFQRFFWLFLKIIVKCDWLRSEDVDERLDECMLCLT